VCEGLTSRQRSLPGIPGDRCDGADGARGRPPGCRGGEHEQLGRAHGPGEVRRWGRPRHLPPPPPMDPKYSPPPPLGLWEPNKALKGLYKEDSIYKHLDTPSPTTLCFGESPTSAMHVPWSPDAQSSRGSPGGWRAANVFFSTTLYVPRGEYEYRFLIDGVEGRACVGAKGTFPFPSMFGGRDSSIAVCFKPPVFSPNPET